MVLFSTAFFMVFLAEMGDKTQLIAMMFATRYPWPKVILGIALASVANHFLAVSAGYYLNGLVQGDIIKLVSSTVFILCGLLMFLPNKEDANFDLKKSKHIIFTIFSVFFLGEFGDKTQLAAFMLSAQTGHSIGLILAGTTIAMLVASGLGIFLGNVLKKYISDSILRTLSGILFILLGAYGLYNYFL